MKDRDILIFVGGVLTGTLSTCLYFKYDLGGKVKNIFNKKNMDEVEYISEDVLDRTISIDEDDEEYKEFCKIAEDYKEKVAQEEANNVISLIDRIPEDDYPIERDPKEELDLYLDSIDTSVREFRITEDEHDEMNDFFDSVEVTYYVKDDVFIEEAHKQDIELPEIYMSFINEEMDNGNADPFLIRDLDLMIDYEFIINYDEFFERGGGYLND